MTLSLFPALIDGEDVTTDATLDVIDPATARPFARTMRSGAAEVDAAVNAARKASDDGWRDSSFEQRGRILRRISEGVLKNREELTELESLDTGKPLKQAGADVAAAARYFEFYASVIETLQGETIPGKDGAFVFTDREPFGVTGHIIPWNYPMQISARTIAPALAAGNCCVLKPAEEAPLTPIRLAWIALEAGLPKGVLNVVPGLGEEAGTALSNHQGIDHIAFTGSREVGTIIAQAAAVNIVPVTLELGGKSPNIVFPDADLSVAAPTIVNSIIQNAGQTCSAGSRLLVHASIYDAVVEQVRERLSALTLGPGREDPELGPLISDIQRQRVSRFVNDALANNEGELLTGGAIPETGKAAHGYFFEPTLISRVSAQARIWREEVFGPVLAAAPFDDEVHAVELANGTDYGMISAVWTKDINRVHRLIRTLRTAQIFVNSYGAGGGVELPFGGYKRSGYGREKGVAGLLEYTQLKTVLIKL